jgi:hypothetical protein
MLLPRTSACWYSANRRIGGMVVSCGPAGERAPRPSAGTPVPARRTPGPPPATPRPKHTQDDRQ